MVGVTVGFVMGRSSTGRNSAALKAVRENLTGMYTTCTQTKIKICVWVPASPCTEIVTREVLQNIQLSCAAVLGPLFGKLIY